MWKYAGPSHTLVIQPPEGPEDKGSREGVSAKKTGQHDADRKDAQAAFSPSLLVFR